MIESQSLLNEVKFPTTPMGVGVDSIIGSQSLLNEVKFPTYLRLLPLAVIRLSQSLLNEVKFPTGREWVTLDGECGVAIPFK